MGVLRSRGSGTGAGLALPGASWAPERLQIHRSRTPARVAFGMLRDLFFIEFIEAIFAATASVVERDYAGPSVFAATNSPALRGRTGLEEA